jgi:transcriptional regulator with XRE-family HTH domain
MSNERLRAAIVAAGLNDVELADRVGVDPKTVQRWVSQERVPHRRTAIHVARELDIDVETLWPADVRTTQVPDELVALYPHRSAVPKTLWFDVLEHAEHEVGLMAYASLFLPEENPEAIGLLRAKARDGVRVRIALGDPDSPEARLRGEEERLYEAIPARIAMAIAYYRPLFGEPGIEFRLHRTTLYNSIFIFDDQMLINQHIYGAYGYIAPILHLQRKAGNDMFDTYAHSFERVWDAGYAPSAETGGRTASRTAASTASASERSGSTLVAPASVNDASSMPPVRTATT